MKFRLDRKSWEAGKRSGINGLPNQPGKCNDSLAWFSGYIEGKAKRRLRDDRTQSIQLYSV